MAPVKKNKTFQELAIVSRRPSALMKDASQWERRHCMNDSVRCTILAVFYTECVRPSAMAFYSQSRQGTIGLNGRAVGENGERGFDCRESSQ